MAPHSLSYDLIEAELKAFSRSAVRTKVILCLLEREKSIAELGKEIGIRNTTLLHSIRDMIESDLLAKRNQVYSLTNIGRIQGLVLDEMIGTIAILDAHKDFWLSHDLSDIPIQLQKNLGMLAQSDLVEGDRISLLKAQEYFMEKVVESKEIHGCSPIYVPGYAEAIAFPVENGAKADLILTDSILKIVSKEHGDLLKKLLDTKDFHLYKIKRDLKIAFTVTDVNLYLGLFRLDGTYDIGQDLYCTGNEAVEWGLDLFKHFRDLSEPVYTLNTFL